ncbi:hypothetical protein MSSIT_0882 [Methanosarcina siciliae T4/M]|uniref:Uncharacterized protein n=2 Tax=Methanosarcina siciliae TaxID=38027 RepID=A0A0E3L7Y9_9EURY|nr:hypothetical protein MSSIT_0882 [Methanosarcina siciliae T4/M]
MERWNKSDLYKCPDLQKTYTRPDLFYYQVVKGYGRGRV